MDASIVKRLDWTAFHQYLTIKTIPQSFNITLFNRVLSSKQYPNSWCIGSLKTIYKKGNKNDPKSYRGITLLPVMEKLFTTILKNRLITWADYYHRSLMNLNLVSEKGEGSARKKQNFLMLVL